MTKFAPIAALAGTALLLTACGSADDASSEASADTVEMPADTALAPIAEEAVADPAAAATDAPVTDTAAEAEAGAEQAADAAADVATEAAKAADPMRE